MKSGKEAEKKEKFVPETEKIEELGSGFLDKIKDRAEVLSLVLFALSIFLMDNNLNIITAYGVDTRSTVFGDFDVRSTDMFWLGFIFSLVFFLIISFRSVYKRQSRLTKFDTFFGIIGGIGFMILLSGGLLGFWHPSSFEIPFFDIILTRVTYYHVGIALTIVTLLYFTMTK